MGYPSYYAQHGWYQIHEGRERPFNENAEQPEHMDSHNFRNIRVRHRLARCIPVVRVAIYLLPLAYLPTEVFFIYQPGPIYYRNNLPAVILASCLLFTSSQLLLLECQATRCTKDTLNYWLARAYWAAATLCTVAYTLCYGIARKWDCFAVGSVTLIACCLAWRRLLELDRMEQCRKHDFRSTSQKALVEMVDPEKPRVEWYSPTRRKMIFRVTSESPKKDEDEVEVQRVASFDEEEDELPWWKSTKKRWMVFTFMSRPLRPLYMVVIILNVYGSARLAQQSLIQHPGERIRVEVPGFGTTHINFYCTTQSVQDIGRKPTVWLEGSSSQGVADFLGVQHSLLDHNISSCSYDPPSFGGSDVSPTKMSDYSPWQPALMKAIERSPIYSLPDTNRNHAYVGWGSSGTKLTVQHALQDKDASLLISLDPMSPDAEFLVQQAKHGWSDAETGIRRAEEISRRIAYQRSALSVGLGWGFLPSFERLIPDSPESYYPASGISTWRSQKLQDQYLARQYGTLLAMKQTNAVDTYLNRTRLPDSMPFRAILSTQPSEDLSDQNQWRLQKMDVIRKLGGAQKPPTYCWNCPRDFPIGRAKWTAEMIAKMLES